MTFASTKIRLLFFLITISSIVFGQEKTTLSNQAKLSFGLHLGVGVSNVSANQLAFPISQTTFSQFKQKRPVNERLGIQLLIHLKKSYGLETGIFYEKNGIKTIGSYDPITNTVDLNDDVTTRYQYEYFTVPVLFKMLFNEEGTTQVSLHLGPYFSFLQSASYSYKTFDLIANPNGTLVQSVREEAFQINEFTRQKDIGLRFRVGAERNISELATLFAYGFYSQGLTRIEEFVTDNPAEISDGRHVVMGITIGGYFRML